MRIHDCKYFAGLKTMWLLSASVTTKYPTTYSYIFFWIHNFGNLINYAFHDFLSQMWHIFHFDKVWFGDFRAYFLKTNVWLSHHVRQKFPQVSWSHDKKFLYSAKSLTEEMMIRYLLSLKKQISVKFET